MMSDQETTMHTDVNPQDAAAETIGERLRRLRTERRLSQRELSEPGVSYAYISRIEANTRTPSVKALRKLARKLGVSPEYLETGSEIGPAEERELRLADAELELRLDADIAGAETALTSLLEEATQAGDVPAATRARLALGLAAAHRGDPAEATQRLEEGIDSGLVTPESRPDVYTTLGRCYAILGKPERSVQLFEQCLEELDDSPEHLVARTRFATYLSYALADLGNLGRAEAVVSDALERAKDLADPYTQVRLYWSLARVASMQGRQNEALANTRRAIALLEATEDTLQLGRAHLLSASILILSGNAERAQSHLELAERLLTSRAEPDDLASLRSEQAKCAAQLGDADAAIEYAQQALQLLGDDNPAEQGLALWALADATALKGDADEAHSTYERAVSLLSDQGRWRDAANCCRSWGRFLRKAGRESEALDVLERAADLAARREPSEVQVSR
jgi:tetratricopeptide (TPR) repeat protein